MGYWLAGGCVVVASLTALAVVIRIRRARAVLSLGQLAAADIGDKAGHLTARCAALAIAIRRR